MLRHEQYSPVNSVRRRGDVGLLHANENTVRVNAVDQDDHHQRAYTHSRSRRGVAANLKDGTQATEDISRGERRARLLPSHKCSSLARFPFNISSMQTESLSLCWPLQLVANSLQATQSRTVIYGWQSREIDALFFPSFIWITSLRCYVSDPPPPTILRFPDC